MKITRFLSTALFVLYVYLAEPMYTVCMIWLASSSESAFTNAYSMGKSRRCSWLCECIIMNDPNNFIVFIFGLVNALVIIVVHTT
jgi:hypothetical protein